MIQVIAIITARPGQREAVLAAFRANVPAVRAEAGCIEYAPVVDVDVLGKHQQMLGTDTFMVIEKWADADALGAHAQAPHMAEYAAKTRELIASRTIHVVESAA